MFAAMYGGNANQLYNSAIQAATASTKLKEESITYNALKDLALSYNINPGKGYTLNSVIHDEYRAVEKSVFESAVLNQDSLKSGDLEALTKKIAEKQAEAREEQAKEKLVELVKVTKWNRVDGGEGSLLSTFPKETKREMLNTLKMVNSGVPHKYKNQYGKNIENKIAVLEYLLKD